VRVRVIAVANNKGGTGKSSVAIHLAEGLARRERRALLVDLDSHGSATRWLLGASQQEGHGAYGALLGAELGTEDCVQVPRRERLWVLPSTPALSRAGVDLAAEVGGETLLRGSLEGLRGRFDVAVLDCPGDLSIVVLAALVAADGIVVPVLSDFLALSGLSRLEDALGRARKRLRAKAELLGYVHFGVNTRHAIAEETRALLQETGRLFSAEVRTSTAAKSLPARQETAWDEGADARGAEDYEALVDEVAERLEELPRRRAHG
jgi:chromosome partitioning protein